MTDWRVAGWVSISCDRQHLLFGKIEHRPLSSRPRMFADNVGEHRSGGTLLSALTDVAMGGVAPPSNYDIESVRSLTGKGGHSDPTC